MRLSSYDDFLHIRLPKCHNTDLPRCCMLTWILFFLLMKNVGNILTHVVTGGAGTVIREVFPNFQLALSSPVNWDSKAQNDRWEESERWVFEPRIMVDDIASGTLQPLLKILNGHLRYRDRDPASATGIFMKLKNVGRSKPQPTGQLQKPT